MDRSVVAKKSAAFKNWSILLILLTFFSVLLTIFFISRSVSSQTELEQTRESCEDAIHQILNASDLLSNKTSFYVDTRDISHMNAYWEEAAVTRSRENAYAALVAADLTPPEMAILERTYTATNNLMGLEAHIMRLVAESDGVPLSDMPVAVASYDLPASDVALSAGEKLSRAKSLLASCNYTGQKESILRCVQSFSYQLNNRFGDSATQTSRHTWLVMILGFSSYVLLLIGLVLVYRRSEILSRDALRSEIEETHVRDTFLHLAMEQLGKHMIRYDLEDELFTSEGESAQPAREIATLLRDFQPLTPAAAEQLQALCRKIRHDGRPSQVDIPVKDCSGSNRFLRFDAFLPDSGEEPSLFAVITYFDCTEQRDRELAYARIRQQYNSMPVDKVALYEYNLTRSVYESASGGLVARFECPRDIPFNDRSRLYAQKYVCHEDRDAFLLFMNRERLLGAYQSGVFSDYLDFRVHTDASTRYHRLSVQMVPYPGNLEVKLYASIQDVDAEKRAELSLLDEAQHDSLTGMYNRKAFSARVEQLFRDASEQRHALILLDVDSFKEINDTFGHGYGDTYLQELTNRIHHELCSDDLIGRIGGDEFMICIAGLPSDIAVARKIAHLSEVLPCTLPDGRTATASMGVARFPDDGDSLDELYRKADVALYKVKRGGKASFCLYSDNMGDLSVAPNPMEKNSRKTQ